MSRKILGIFLAVIIVLAVFLFGYWYLMRDTGTPPEEQNGTELVESLPEENGTTHAVSEEPEEERADSAEEPEEEYQFILVNNNNYVAVYRLPENEIYEYTDVILDVLPAELQEEIREGKYLKNEEELYNFLENYTS